MVPILTPENQTLPPFFKPPTLSNTALIRTAPPKRFCCPPMMKIPATKMTMPKKTNKPTITERFLSADFILFYKVIIVKRFDTRIVGRKNLVEIPLSLKCSVQQHYNPIAYTLGTNQIVGNDDRGCFILVLNAIDQVVDFNTGNRIEPGCWLIVEHDIRI